LHRITGVAVILFLFAHVVDTAVIGWGPKAYNRVISVYHNWFVQLLELGLVAAVLYHAINGVKIMLFDFWPATARRMKPIAFGSTLLFVLAMIPITIIMGKGILESAGVL
jgi:succinate dehydrogenase / fumarate reductase cytochrome b subunit